MKFLSKKDPYKKSDKILKTAFSLIELSIVILIIGVLVTGITQSSRLVAAFRLSSARSTTEASPVPSIKDLSLWLEASSVKSISDLEATQGVAVSQWNDINPTSSYKGSVAATGDQRPTYIAQCINQLPCLRFNGTTNYIPYNGTILANSDYTIFIVEKRNSDAAFNFFFGTSDTSISPNEVFNAGYVDDTTLAFSHANNDDLGITVPAYSPNAAVIHTFIFDRIDGRSYYHNSGSRHKNVDTVTPLAANNNATIGRVATYYYDGDIGEIIIFTRAIKKSEKEEVEKYLSKKWRITPEEEGDDIIYVSING